MSHRKYATPFEILHAANLLSQKSRLRKFEKVIKRIVKQGMIVADIGTGTGILAFLAARAGAAKVIGIDVNELSLEYARHAARLNGLDNTVEFHLTHFLDFIPEEKCDIVICEMLSSFMLIEQQVPASHHITKHILKPSGRLIPRSAKVFGILCQSEDMIEQFEFQGLVFPKLPQSVSNQDVIELSEMEMIEEFDFQRLHEPHHVNKVVSFEIIRNGVIHGLCGMFEAVLDEDTILDMEDGWRTIFIPFETPVRVQAGQQIEIKVGYTPGKFDSIRLERIED